MQDPAACRCMGPQETVVILHTTHASTWQVSGTFTAMSVECDQAFMDSIISKSSALTPNPKDSRVAEIIKILKDAWYPEDAASEEAQSRDCSRSLVSVMSLS